MAWTYEGASAILATMHGKEEAIAPALRQCVGMDIITSVGLDTDALGTFTGEVPRIGNMREVAVRKARLGMAASGLPIGIASEGSFGPHPAAPFLRAGLELMVLVDDERNVVITESLVAEDTNYDEIVVQTVTELEQFLSRVGFPRHALVVAPNRTLSPWWRLHPELSVGLKGLRSHEDLAKAVQRCSSRSEDGRARVTTDMRAHMNPTRMKSIAVLADRFARRIARHCPDCGAPGFGRVAPAPGVPCRICGDETIVPRGDRLKCVSCGAEHEQSSVPLRAFAEPDECPSCNP